MSDPQASIPVRHETPDQARTHRTPASTGYREVPPTGFEPVISCVKGNPGPVAARYATVQIARNRGGFNRSVARSTTSRGGRHVRKKFGRPKTGPAAASAARPRRSPSLPQCGRASSFMLGLASTRAFAPERSGGASASTNGRSQLTDPEPRVWRREPEGPRALDGVCPAVGGDCRPRLCVPGSSSAGRATFSP